jgi:hypothetical protein
VHLSHLRRRRLFGSVDSCSIPSGLRVLTALKRRPKHPPIRLFGAVLPVAVLAALWLLVPTAHAQDGSTGLAVLGAQPIAVELTKVPGGVAGSVDLIVRNDSSYAGPLVVRFIAPGQPDVAQTADPAMPTQGVGLYAPASEKLDVSTQSAVALHFQLRAQATPKAPITGALVVSAAKSSAVPPATAQIVATPSAAKSRWANAYIEPASVNLTASGCNPALLGWDCSPPGSTDVHLKGLTPGAPISAGEKIATVEAGADTGGHAIVTLVAINRIGGSATSGSARVEINHITRYGSYSATLPVDRADAKAPSLPVKITARDFVAWPLIPLIGGALVFYFLLRYRETKRPKRVLQRALTSAADRYGAAARAIDHPTRAQTVDERALAKPYTLNKVFPDRDEWPCPSPDDATEAQELFCKIADASTSEDLQGLAALVAFKAAQADTWLVVCEQATALDHSLNPLRAIHPPPAIVAASEKLVTGQKPPPDAAALAAFEQQLANQTTAVQTLQTAWALYQRAEELFDELNTGSISDEDRSGLEQHNPAALRDAYLLPPKSLADLDPNVLGVMRETVRWLDAVKLAQPPARTMMLAMARGLPVTIRTGLAGAATAQTTAPSLRRPQPMSTSERLLDEIKSRDVVDFLLSTFLAGLAYFLTIYPNTAFGSVWQYLAAFAAGATGTLAVNWKLLPWWRSYRPPPASTTNTAIT